MHDATAHLDAPSPTHTSAPAGESRYHEETSALSPTGQSGVGTGADGDHEILSRTHTVSSPHSELIRHNPDPTRISTTHPMPGLHSGAHEYAQTRYVEMLLDLDDIPTKDKHEVAAIINNVPLLVIAWVCTGVGAVGMVLLWWQRRKNYIWIRQQDLRSLSSIDGTLGALVSTTALSTIITTGAILVICALLVVIYQFVLIRRLRKEHDRIEQERQAGKGKKEV
ncbi:hypothetical protein BKA83DRAFT_22602 [Pisolithus microcarpus]|nr:hypothetical protein BKA83DRAFT_22602 [Pisolithus microcarpus]